jgi:hypothetical protein
MLFLQKLDQNLSLISITLHQKLNKSRDPRELVLFDRVILCFIFLEKYPTAHLSRILIFYYYEEMGNEPIRISAKNLGQLALPDWIRICLDGKRGLWYFVAYKR